MGTHSPNLARTALCLAAVSWLLPLAACDGSSAQDTPRPAAQPPSGWRTYGDAPLRFSIAYPARWHADRSYAYWMRIDGRELRGVAFTIPPDFEVRTNLARDTRLTVESAPGAPSCSARLFLDSPQNELQETDGGHSWSVATGGDAGAGNFYDETVYALTDSSPCIAIRYFIHSTNVANYDPGTVRQFDRAALVTMFDRIRSTLARSDGHDETAE